MDIEENTNDRFQDYKNMEISLHRDLMNSCRRYISRLSIVSILGILDVVKQESVELEKETRNNIKNEELSNIEKEI